MDYLWAPWRGSYIFQDIGDRCIFCTDWDKKDDKKHLILFRSDNSLIMINRFPYNSGHIMVAPQKHISNLVDLNEIESNDLFRLLIKGLNALKKSYNPHGFNVGMNIGKAAGAGFDSHIHLHIVPRWNGDTNFMPVLADTKVIPQHLEEVYERLYPILNEE